MVAAQLGMRSVLVLHTDDPAKPPSATGNILLDRLVGADIRWVSHAAWRERTRLLADEVERVRSAGGTPYLVPEGGSNALGSWGYIRAARELAEDLRGIAAPDHPVTVVYVCGSAGTGAGLVLGAKLHGFDQLGIRVAGVNVRDARAFSIDAIGRICGEFEQRWPLGVHVTADDIDMLDGLGAGYARSLPEELVTIRDVCRSDGIVLDPVYTGKAFHRMVTELRRDPQRFGKAVAFLHSGGTFGLFAAADTVAQVL
jgi:D-cysteine desulfhydrase